MRPNRRRVAAAVADAVVTAAAEAVAAAAVTAVAEDEAATANPVGKFCRQQIRLKPIAGLSW